MCNDKVITRLIVIVYQLLSRFISSTIKESLQCKVILFHCTLCAGASGCGVV